MAIDGYRLGIDFGTSSTVAVLRWSDGRTAPLMFDASPLLASGVFAGSGEALLTGADAGRAALADPAGFEATPKQRIGEEAVWLGRRERAVVDLVAAVLYRVAAEAVRIAGRAPAAVTLTHPASWPGTRLAVLAEAARRAGLGAVRFVAEPVAAAAYFVDVLGTPLPPGACLVVYDLGAGTFDVSVVRRSAAGFDPLRTAGLADVGGLDLDALVVRHARSLTMSATDAWIRLDRPGTTAERQAHRALWHGARAVKEQLSRHASADLYVPLVDALLHLTRTEFERAARPCLDRTVALTASTVRDAGVQPEAVAGIVLVGGASRVPLVATLLHQAFDRAPTVTDQPELVVAHGAVRADPRPPSCAAGSATASPAPVSDAAADQPLPADPPVRVRRPGRVTVVRRASRLLSTAAVMLLVLATVPGAAPLARLPFLRTADGNYIAITFDGEGRLGALHADGNLHVWDPASRRQLAVVEVGLPPSDGGWRVVSHGRFLTLSADDSDVTGLWDITGQARATLAGRVRDAVVVGADGRFAAATGAPPRVVYVWDLAEPQDPATPRTARVLDTDASAVAISPDAATFATCGDGVVRIWSLSDLRPLGNALPMRDRSCAALAFSPTGELLAAASLTLNLWNIATRELTATLPASHLGVAAMTFSPDGQTIATVDQWDGQIRIWSTAGRLLGSPLQSGPWETQLIAISPDRRTLVTAVDPGLEMWDITTYR